MRQIINVFSSEGTENIFWEVAKLFYNLLVEQGQLSSFDGFFLPTSLLNFVTPFWSFDPLEIDWLRRDKKVSFVQNAINVKSTSSDTPLNGKQYLYSVSGYIQTKLSEEYKDQRRKQYVEVPIYMAKSKCTRHFSNKSLALARLTVIVSKKGRPRSQRKVRYSYRRHIGQESRGLVGSSVISDPGVPGSNSTAVNSFFLCHFLSSVSWPCSSPTCVALWLSVRHSACLAPVNCSCLTAFVGQEANLLMHLQEPPRGDGASTVDPICFTQNFVWFYKIVW